MASGDPAVSVDPGTGDVHLAWNDETVFQFAIRAGQRLPLESGDEQWFDDEDVIQYTGQTYSMVLDGSDVGLAEMRIDALARLSAAEYILSFADPGEIPGAGWVDDSDLVLFQGKRLGAATAGTFSLWFRGADAGLTEDSEDIDAVDVVEQRDAARGALQNRDIYFSTTGAVNTVGGTSGRDEDIIVCRSAVTGAKSACGSLARSFKGAAAGFSGGDEGLDAFSFDGVGPGQDDEQYSSYYSTTGPFSVGKDKGNGADALQCVHPEEKPAAEPLAACGTTSVPLHKVFDGTSNALVENITALEFPYKA
jgi:hypothetical protein